MSDTHPQLPVFCPVSMIPRDTEVAYLQPGADLFDNATVGDMHTLVDADGGTLDCQIVGRVTDNAAGIFPRFGAIHYSCIGAVFSLAGLTDRMRKQFTGAKDFDVNRTYTALTLRTVA